MAKELFNSSRYEKKGFIPNLFNSKINVFIWTGCFLWILSSTIALQSFVFFIGGIIFFGSEVQTYICYYICTSVMNLFHSII